MKRHLCLLAVLCLTLSAGFASGSEDETVELHLRLVSMKEARAPEIIGDKLVLSAKGPWRTVAAAFESEHFTALHPYQRNKQGVFFLVMNLPLKARAPIAYRLVVDGAWIADPLNPLKSHGASGYQVSLAEVPYISDQHRGTYHILGADGHTAHFLYKGEAGMAVTLAGTFNNWDPFLYEMEETSPGVYELEVDLLQGIHYYVFYFDGEAHSDPLNIERATNPAGEVVSVLYVGVAPPAVKASAAPKAEGGGGH